MGEIFHTSEDSVKNIIIKILSLEWPLSAKKIYHKVKKTHKKNVTYQAVFKLLKILTEKGMLSKSKYEYSLNKAWIHKSSDFYEDLKRSYESKPQNFIQKILTNPTITLHFDTYYEFLLALAETMNKISFVSKKDGYRAYAEIRHLYWPFAAGVREHKLLRKAFKKYKNFYILCKSDTKADRLVYGYYKTLNPNVFVKFKQDCAQDYEVLITGDYVAKIYAPEEIKRSMDTGYLKLKDKLKPDIEEIYNSLFLKKTKITAIVIRNPELAKIGKEKILAGFK